MSEVYKIRRKSDGKFSMGGSEPSFGLTGKIWKRSGDLSNHLNLVNEKAYKGCELVVLELVEVEVRPIENELLKVQIRADEREADRLRRIKEYQIKRDREQLVKLKAKYPDFWSFWSI